MTGHTKTLRGRQLLSPITDSNKQFSQAPQASTTKLTQPYPTQQTLFGRVLATDPAVTAALWARVRGAMPAETRAMGKNKDSDRGKGGRGRGRGRGGRGGGGRGGGGGQLGGGQHDSKKRKRNMPQGDEGEELGEEPDDLLTVVDTIQTKLTKVTSRNPYFQSLVLRPRRIIKEKNNEGYKNPYSHFETTAPLRGDLLNYTAIEDLDAAEIWLFLSNDQVEQIIDEYQSMKNRRVCEREYASFVIENFLRR
jgi:hypothetical protein